jgi:hypothetical protein
VGEDALHRPLSCLLPARRQKVGIRFGRDMPGTRVLLIVADVFADTRVVPEAQVGAAMVMRWRARVAESGLAEFS